ncbi:hypothetical protein LL912_02750 [Niabella sp. CC-SYL272]|uniref:DUF6799 domain-containing protein n=1 Tax=Niabella agricola TaxID=2891571 RepID=UPI001F230BE1|nr:DUF6799 domain-containing protein [Niabella agricola]MCF3107691.1 hypothetical protein [Niabella agricola]
MKKVTLAMMALFFITSAATAQESKKKPEAVQKTTQQKQTLAECCIMKGKKMFHYKDGKETPITKEEEINHMNVSPDGTCKMKDGKTIKLKSGECCDAKGAVHKNCQTLLKKG